MNSPLKIAVYAIALNEAKHAARWAESCVGADYRVVADTGSTDETRDILNQAGVHVHKITVKPWRFDVARNAALALVPGDVDVCVSVDLDEVPEAGFFDKLRAAWTPGTQRAWVNFDTGTVWQNNNRVHGRHGYRWVCPCHEVTQAYHEQVERQVMVEALIRHQPDNSRARTAYLPLLELAVREAPQDARMWTYLTREYRFRGEHKQVLRCAEVRKNMEGWAVETAAVCRWAGEAARAIGLAARPWFEAGTKAAPTELEAFHALAFQCYLEEDWEACFEAAMKVNNLARSSHYLAEPDVWLWRMWDLAALAGWKLGKKDKARDCARKALVGNPGDARLARNVKEMAA
jgi:hypothetical protein